MTPTANSTVLEQATPTRRSLVFPISLGVAGLVIFIGAFLSWVTVTVPLFGSVSVAGTVGDGKITLWLGLIVLGFAIAAGFRSMARLLVIPALVSLAVLIIGLVDAIDLLGRISAAQAELSSNDVGQLGGDAGSLFQASLGVGLILTMVAGAAGAGLAGTYAAKHWKHRNDAVPDASAPARTNPAAMS